jgi:hypothetical protein
MGTQTRSDGHDEVDSIDAAVSARRPWETPRMSELDLSQTAFQPGVGTDGETHWFDCTRT